MKTRFNTFDIVCVVAELQKYVGMRVNNIYDIDNKTYLIKLQRTEEKAVILLESGNRIHSTVFEWPKNVAPSGFSMKMRKHLKNKRLESLTQLGTDRIIDLKFGSNEAAYHLILELYDRGNVILTDFEMKILYILRPHTENEETKFAVREVYPQNRARVTNETTREKLKEILENAKPGEQLKKILVGNLEFGPAVIEHVLQGKNFSSSTKIGKSFDVVNDFEALLDAVKEAEEMFELAKNGEWKGYIMQKKVEVTPNSEVSYFNSEFHPVMFRQHQNEAFICKEFDNFNSAVDEFFSNFESQKLELRACQREKEAWKKLDNVKKDHTQRLEALEKTQEVDKKKAELITRNQEIVDKAILAVQSAIATQLSWTDIGNLVKDASAKGDEVAGIIKKLKLETNHISVLLSDPYRDSSESEGSEDEEQLHLPSMLIDIDLALTAYANATRYYDKKKHAAKKQRKTLESQSKAFKSAEKKTKQTLKDVQTIVNINKARKIYWFEKFFWFITSENYLVIAGRDQQQNELIVKRYMREKDVYVHADIHGASSVIIKNPTGQPVPPKTLNEAGTCAICYSVAWEAKVVTNAYWVWGEQVSKTAPTGEYLTTGSFMIRGRKNFLPPNHLILGLSFLFKLEDGHVEKHRGERRVNIEPSTENVQIEHDTEEIVIESDTEEQGNDEENAFPDTKLKIEHRTDTEINILAEPVEKKVQQEKEDEIIVFLGDDKPVRTVLKNRNRTNSTKSDHSRNVKFDEFHNEGGAGCKQQTAAPSQIKRGQKSKLKKIKEKYKDQDEEERQLRMEILQSSGAPKENKKDSKKNKDSNKNPQKAVAKPQFKKSGSAVTETGEEEEIVVQADVDMIDALTGVPTPEDELLFAVPVIAPYNTLTNYKFKVKLTPGTGKKGKAAKTAVAIFLKDRSITQREKDLLKAVKDDQLARNFPGKVKLSAPKLQTVKK